jgi:recombinational DNA repair protein (RecF pathway)
MRHKYQTRGIVLARMPFGETHARLAIVTEELGLVYARAAGIRSLKSKLAHALTTFAESDLVLVEGVEGWRVAGAVLAANWFSRLASAEARERAGRVAGLLVRLSPGEAREGVSYALLCAFFETLAEGEAALAEGAELVAAESVIAAFGVGKQSIRADFTAASLAQALTERTERIARINRGIEASGL